MSGMQKPMVAREQLFRWIHDPFGGIDGDCWESAKRVWPDPEEGLANSIPKSVRVSLDEARNCLSGKNCTASLVMSGRALEAIARHFHLEGKADRLMLAKGLEELYANRKSTNDFISEAKSFMSTAT